MDYSYCEVDIQFLAYVAYPPVGFPPVSIESKDYTRTLTVAATYCNLTAQTISQPDPVQYTVNLANY